MTVPFWGFRNLSIAMTDVMMADLPHVLYNHKDVITDDEIKVADEQQKQLREKMKQGGGLASRFNLNNEVDTNKYVEKKINKA